MTVPELVEKAVYARKVRGSDREMDSVSFSLQFVLEVIESCTVGKSDIGILAADPLNRSQRELGLRFSGPVDPTLMPVTEYLASAYVTGRNHRNGRAVALLSEANREGPLSNGQYWRGPAAPISLAHIS